VAERRAVDGSRLKPSATLLLQCFRKMGSLSELSRAGTRPSRAWHTGAPTPAPLRRVKYDMADVTPIRAPDEDWLLTPQNAVLALIDYQPDQYAGVGSIAHDELVSNVTLLGRIATAFELPVVLSTVYVKHGMSGTNRELREALPGVNEIDRTSMNSWEDPEFQAAVKRTGRKKLILAGLWTEVCVAFPALDALREGFQVYFVVDAIGGVSHVAHEAAMQRMVQAGATPISVLGLACELQRDWGRPGADRLRATMRAYFSEHRALKSRAQ
jgi:nicotinamidase-related amidase